MNRATLGLVALAAAIGFPASCGGSTSSNPSKDAGGSDATSSSSSGVSGGGSGSSSSSDAGPPPLCCVSNDTGVLFNIVGCGMGGMGGCGLATCPNMAPGAACSSGPGCGSSSGGGSGSSSSGGTPLTWSIVACPVCSSGIYDVNGSCQGNGIEGWYQGDGMAPIGGQYPFCACPGSTICRQAVAAWNAGEPRRGRAMSAFRRS